MPWPKGKPRPSTHRVGRKAGIPNKSTLEVREWTQKILEDPVGQARLLASFQNGTISDIRLTLLMHYAYGKPKEQIAVTGAEGGPLQIIMQRRVGAEDRELPTDTE